MSTASADEPASIAVAAVLDVIEWLTGNECHELDDAGLIAGLGGRLRAAGLPVDLLSLHLRTLHPEIIGRSVAWAPGEPVEIRDREHGIELSPAFIGSPLRRVMETREPLVVSLDTPNGAAWMQFDLFRDRGLAELMFVPLCNSDGPVSAAAFCTRRAGGFAPGERAALDRIVPALRTACELRTLRQVELTVLDTYIGSTTAKRILAGRIRRGQTESLEAALMLCDLRGFTELSNRLPADRVLALLDSYFDRVIPAIVGAGGEVLKFMGDGVLAFFHADDAALACVAALEGGLNALAALEQAAAPDALLRAGIALHYGTVSYGNIGSGRRLDFTVIGPDVNMVSRIQEVCSATGQSLIMSQAFAGLLGSETREIGSHSLRGFAAPVPLHVLPER
jgi:adenylate cyclase